MIIEFNFADKYEIRLLKDFILSLSIEKESFRYFNKRSLECLKNHCCTVLYFSNNFPIGYGHLDKENDVIWLGVCVLEKYQNLGLGSQIMDFLINKAEALEFTEINLTVDKTNLNAIKLYERKGFKLTKDSNQILKYTKKIKL
jgi:GNAT superfamily N-acetyltransferase